MKERLAEIIVGRSQAIVALRETILRIAPSKLSVLIEGPTGSGKELVARALHLFSGRKGALVTANVCAIAPAVFENEVFGHRRGGFTGATIRHDGLLAQAHGGTLFLDEIGGLGRTEQAKLLRALEDGEYRPVGGSREEQSVHRLVSATNEGLADLVAAGTFRSDLRYRISAISMVTTALDERPEDIAPLVETFTRRIGHDPGRLTPCALDELMCGAWPGGVRQLRHFVELVLELHGGDVDRTVVRDLRSAAPVGPGVTTDNGDGTRARMLEILERHRWHIPTAALEAGVHIATFYRQMKRLGVPSSRARTQ